MASNFVWFLFDQVEMCEIEIKDTDQHRVPESVHKFVIFIQFWF